jgi:hypothetical protein
MTITEINEQVRIIRQATKTGTKSKTDALKFLTDAGIVKAPTAKVKANTTKK